ncbi:hypothetical protein M758_7G040900 [Ceratodon purpureus]|nr:hypothetical protein M758_7G040900 [Ceratodon purpureus]
MSMSNIPFAGEISRRGEGHGLKIMGAAVTGLDRESDSFPAISGLVSYSSCLQELGHVYILPEVSRDSCKWAFMGRPISPSIPPSSFPIYWQQSHLHSLLSRSWPMG